MLPAPRYMQLTCFVQALSRARLRLSVSFGAHRLLALGLSIQRCKRACISVGGWRWRATPRVVLPVPMLALLITVSWSPSNGAEAGSHAPQSAVCCCVLSRAVRRYVFDVPVVVQGQVPTKLSSVREVLTNKLQVAPSSSRTCSQFE